MLLNDTKYWQFIVDLNICQGNNSMCCVIVWSINPLLGELLKIPLTLPAVLLCLTIPLECFLRKYVKWF